MTVAETARLRLRMMVRGDAPFVLELLNDPDWLRNLEDATRYIENGPLAMVERHGFGLYVVEPLETAGAIGICGLIRRAGLDDVDLGFAFLPAGRGRGYARESAAAVVALAHERFALQRLVAIVTPGNRASIAVLEHCGMAFERRMRLPGDGEELALYAIDLAALRPRT